MLRSKALQSLQSVPLHCAVRKCGRRIFTYHRAYHSYEHETNPPFTPAETAILSAAFSHVPAYGFTEMALARGARDAGYLDASLNLFPNGAFALVNYHLITKRLALAESQPPANGACSVAEEIKSLVLKRLHANRPIIHHWQQVCHQLLPSSCRGMSYPSINQANLKHRTGF